MKRPLLLLFVLLLASALRLFSLGTFPATLYGDEQAFAWNAYSILKTGTDEYGTPYPLQFRSFNDYKAPVPVYLLVPFLEVFGLNAFGVRLPVAISGVGTVLMTYFLAGLFFRRKIALLAAFFLAISPWHVHLSRGYFESTMSIVFVVSGMYFFLKSTSLKNMIISMVCFACSIYTYFTPRIYLPLMLLFLLAYVRGKYPMKHIVMSFGFVCILCLPLLYATVFGSGFSRYSKLSESRNSVVTQTVIRERNASGLPPPYNALLHNKYAVLLRTVTEDYLTHFSMDFWYLRGDTSLRYYLGNMGMFYLYELPFIAVGVYMMVKHHTAAALFFFVWICMTSLPAALVGRPFGVRSLAMLPAPYMFVAYGIWHVFSYLKYGYKTFVIQSLLVCMVAGSMVLVLTRYYFDYPKYAATWWGYENYAAITYAKEHENDYDYIFISDFYTGSPLAFAVYATVDPLEYQYAMNNPVNMADGRQLIKMGKYYFGSLDIDSKRLQQGIIPPRSLYFARPEEADSEEAVRDPGDTRILFKIYKTR